MRSWQVLRNDDGSSRSNAAITDAVASMAAAVKLAEEKIRSDMGLDQHKVSHTQDEVSGELEGGQRWDFRIAPPGG